MKGFLLPYVKQAGNAHEAQTKNSIHPSIRLALTMFEDAEGRPGTAATSSVDLGRVVIGQFRNLTIDDGRQRVYLLNLKP